MHGAPLRAAAALEQGEEDHAHRLPGADGKEADLRRGEGEALVVVQRAEAGMEPGAGTLEHHL